MCRKMTLSKRLFIVFTCILIPLLIIEFAMFSWGTYAVSDELTSAARSNVVYLRDGLERNLRNIYTQAENLLLNEQINELFVYYDRLQDPDYYMRIRSIQALLEQYKYTSPYIEDIRLFYVSQGICISTEKSVGYSNKVDQNRLLEKIDNLNGQTRLLGFDDENAKYLVWAVKPQTNPRFYIEILLSTDALTEHLMSFSNYSNKNALMYCHQTGRYITSSKFEPGDDVIEELYTLLSSGGLLAEETRSVYSDSDEYLYVFSYSATLRCSFVQIIPATSLKTIPNRFLLFIVTFSLFALAGALVFSVILRRTVSKPLYGIVSAFENVGDGDFDMTLETNKTSSNELYVVSNGFNEMTSRLKQLVETNYAMTIQLQRAELKQLQAQINPHFLYNSFFFVRHMVQDEDNERAVIMLNSLGEYFKFITRNSQNTETIESEYEHTMNYLNIQKMRFEGKVFVAADPVPERLRQITVPRLMLQPIFENVFEYCELSSGHPLDIHVRFVLRDDGYFLILIDDNGTKLTDEKIAEINKGLNDDSHTVQTTGLMNIHRRIKLMFGIQCGLNVTRSAYGGMRVQIKLHEGIYKTDV